MYVYRLLNPGCCLNNFQGPFEAVLEEHHTTHVLLLPGSSLHLIRRSTFIAAVIRFEKPVADLSALGVERIGIVVLLSDSIP
jgi:hypothetical protein